MGGRGSMATQGTDRELAPDKAAGKVLVPLGRECHWETSRPGFRSLQRSFFAEVWFLSTGHLQQQSYAMSVSPTPTERGSLSSCPLLGRRDNCVQFDHTCSFDGGQRKHGHAAHRQGARS
ncbi:unnamed protein product [Effrenium voratum]|nr:unnamed protein product [Effrenium voratum]